MNRKNNVNILKDLSFIEKVIIKKNKDITYELLKLLIDSIKSFDIIKQRNQISLNCDNLGYFYIVSTEMKNVLFIEYIIKNNCYKICFYESFRNQRIDIKITDITEIYEYSLISIYINNNDNEKRNIFSSQDFKNMINDIKSMISIKIFLVSKKIDISELYNNYSCSIIEMLYINHFIKNNKEKIIYDTFDLSIKFCSKNKKYINTILLKNIFSKLIIK